MKFRNLILAVLSILWLAITGLSQDANTLLLLKFENSLNGEQGETPTSATGHSFQAGIQSQGALLPNPNQINYTSANNINALEGTIEFWMKPTWNGNDNQGHFLVRWGGGGGLVLGKDGANNLRIILNRFGTFPGGERGVAVNIGSWTANNWHHVAFTFSNTQKKLRVFVDGTQRAENVFTGDLPSISDSTFQIGGDGAGQYIQSVVDELHISNIARTPQEIAARFISALTITSLSANPNTLQMLPTWWKTPTLQAVTNLGTLNIPATSATWTSSNPAVATFDTNRGKIVAHSAGTATLTAMVNGTSANITVNVTAPVLPPLVEQISPHLSVPNPNALWEMPVVIINYLPTTDGINLNSQIAGETSTLAAMRERINRINIQHKFMLEEGSRFRGYGSSAVNPSLGYRVVSIITVYEELLPLDSTCSNGSCQPDYEQILARFGGENFVNNLGVKEFWIWGYHFGNIYPVESNMASPITGDISNSFRINDLPIYNKTYVLYNYNFGRTAAEATHNHGHQLESILSFCNQRQDGNTQLFWQKFVGRAANGAWQRGRAGDTHHPPNALADYDYSNTTPFQSDIANWIPNGGTTQSVSLPTWRNINYPFPDSINPPSDDSWWYIYWFQSMPGRGNSIIDGSNRMTDWWQFTGDWDAAIRSGVGLYEASSCTFTPSSSGQNFTANGGNGAVSVTAGTSCKWFASSNAPWVSLVSGDLGNGNGTINFSVAPNTSGSQRTTKIIVAGQVFTVTQSSNRKTTFDYDGDGKTDLSIFRPASGEWWYQKSSNGGNFAAQFGSSTDKIVPADYTGDGKTDFAFFRPSLGQWFVLRSEDFSFFAFPFGNSTDTPVPADYDGDGKADAAVFRESSLTWFISKSTGGTDIIGFGATGDKPVVGDYDGDGKADIAIYRNNGGVSEWWIRRSSNGSVFAAQFGASTDKAVFGDYTGDGKTDIAVWRPSNGNWFVLRSEDFSFYAFPFGANGDVPVAGDYDGDGRFDAGVFRPTNQTWFVQRSTAGTLIQQFGIAGDLPTPNAFVP